MQFVLLFIGIILIAINIRAIKEDKSPKSEGFTQNLSVAHDNMDKNEAEIMKMRKEMGETFYSLQEEIEDLKKYIEKLEDKIVKESYEESVVQNIDTLDEEEAILPNSQYNDKKVDEHKEEVKVSNSNNIKIEEIKKLIDEGKDIDEIYEILNMGKGEILLIKDLYLG